MRLAFSIITGVLAAFLVTLIVAVVPTPWLQMLGPFTYLIPPLCGGFVGGYIVQKCWWLAGIIIGIVTETCLLLFMIMIAAANFGLSKGAEMAGQVLPDMWWESIQKILLCIAGAYLGQFFARMVKKRTLSTIEQDPRGRS